MTDLAEKPPVPASGGAFIRAADGSLTREGAQVPSQPKPKGRRKASGAAPETEA
ncbi:hypothetical protein [Frigidibacter oleivorans]|uniref:hypothetical protein n=1 Tax=Frigidibacter oleivorans TaxID=2487129 RepID=UPI0013E0A03E|nr:hypothetical protein [Frigidibacter oleivorans]